MVGWSSSHGNRGSDGWGQASTRAVLQSSWDEPAESGMECLLVSGTTLEGSLGQVSQVYTASGSDKFAGGVQWMMINNCTVVAVYINGEA